MEEETLGAKEEAPAKEDVPAEETAEGDAPTEEPAEAEEAPEEEEVSDPENSLAFAEKIAATGKEFMVIFAAIPILAGGTPGGAG